MSSDCRKFGSWLRVFVFSIILFHSSALNSDGILLLSFKYSILSDPLSVLGNWNYEDAAPCAWNGVTCTQIGDPGTPTMFRVTSLVLPNSKLLGSIPKELGMIEHLTYLDLSSNFFNGSLPPSIFNSSKLEVLALSNNAISGELPESIAELKSLRVLNLSDNALGGRIPVSLTSLKNLTVVSLKSNYFSGGVPSGFESVEVLDLSANLLNGSLPSDFRGSGLRYLNLSYNKLSGMIPSEFATKIPRNATIDLSFNNLSGAIPDSLAWADQKTEFLAGNTDLCGKPLKILCSIPSTLSTPPNTTTTPPAIAVIPKTVDANPSINSSDTSIDGKDQTPGGLKPGTIAGIALGDLAGIGVLALVILYVYQLKKRKHDTTKEDKTASGKNPEPEPPTQDLESRKPTTACSCLTINGQETSTTSGSSSSSECEDHDADRDAPTNIVVHHPNGPPTQKPGTLITVDGETRLELDTLLRASAYILGASGGSIVYKAVLEDGTVYAVRRIGEGGVERLKEFESQVRAMAKLKHPNVVRVRGFYWGEDEKLVIYDYVPSGSLAHATAGYRKGGSSPFHLPLELRLRIARGIARGLAYIHDKKHVHANLKPSNILLSSDMVPLISDLGLNKLLLCKSPLPAGGSASSRRLGSQRFASVSNNSDNVNNNINSNNNSPFLATSSSVKMTPSPYQAPESLQSVKPSYKWDVYSFGVILLELLTGRVFLDRDLVPWAGGAAGSSFIGEDDRGWVLRMADVAIRGDVASREEVVLGCFKLGFSCASQAPHKRPSMKEALHALEKMIT